MTQINVNGIPKEMRDQDQWVGWNYAWRKDRKGNLKRTKEPIDAKTGCKASSTNPKTWSPFGEAWKRLEAGDVDGIGFCFNDDYIGTDLDKAVDDDDKLKPWAEVIVKDSGSYTERSPSRKGVHIIIRGSLPVDWRGLNRNYEDGKIEIYCRSRFFTVTGDVFGGLTEILDSREIAKALYRRIDGLKPDRNAHGNRRRDRSAIPLLGMEAQLEVALRDPVFRQLYAGDISGNNNDTSAADLAFCNKAVFYFGPDPQVIDATFHRSGLMRDKWDRDDYRRMTIDKAIEGTPETYQDNGRPHDERRPDDDGDADSNDSDEEKPKPPATLKNAVRAIQDRHLSYVYYDEFLRRPMTGTPAREWTDADDRELTVTLQSAPGFSRIGLEIVRQAALTVAYRNRRNCVKDWLESLTWDGEVRIEHFFKVHFGAKASSYTRAVSKNFWLSIVARVYQPGCQVDNTVVLEGPQGIRKSSALRVIGGEWFAEQHEAVTARGFFEVLQGKIIVEISELDAFSRADVTKVKQVITCTNDRFRESYGHHAEDHPRQCVFVATTNRDDWNRDETGARRFWPISCKGEIDIEAIRTYRDQFFAEAVHRFKDGETWWKMPQAKTKREQAKRYVAPAWVEPIQRYIDHEQVEDSTGAHWITRPAPRADVSIAEVFQCALDLPESQWTKANEMRAAECLRYMGWTKRDVYRNGKVTKRWLPPRGGKTRLGSKRKSSDQCGR